MRKIHSRRNGGRTGRGLGTAQPHDKPNLTTRLGRNVEQFTYLEIVLAALSTILICAALLFLLTPSGNGLQGDSIREDPNYSFALLGNAVYFCIVTFSSLGYGEITPIGFGRIVSCGEVAVGLSLIALLIGKLASERQSATLLVLLSSDMERRLSVFAENLSTLASRLNAAHVASATDQIQTTTSELYGTIIAIKKYIAFNANQFPAAFNNNASAVASISTQIAKTYCSVVLSIESDFVRPSGAIEPQETREELVRLLELLRGLPPGQSTPVRQTVKAIRQIDERHSEWIESKAKSIMMDKVLALAPDRSLSRWPQGHHKIIAAHLKISNSEVTRFVNDHIRLGTLSK